ANLLDILSIFDVDARSVPFDDVPLVVAQWHRADEEPPILAVGSPDPCFCLERTARCDGAAPLVEQHGKVLGMNGDAATPAKALLHRETGVLVPAMVEEINGAVWQRAPDLLRDGVDDDAQASLEPGRTLVRRGVV